MIRHRDYFILLFITIISVITALLLNQQVSTSMQNDSETLLAKTLLQASSINSITLMRDSKTYKYEKEGVAWKQIEPFVLSMDSASMRAIINAAMSIRILSNPLDASKESLGFLAQNSISFSDGINESIIFLGRKTLGGRGYAMLDNGTPFVVSHELHLMALEMDYKLWRDVRVFPNFAIDGSRISRKVNDERMVLLRENGIWNMQEPVSTRVNQQLLTEWVGKIAAAQVTAFVADYPEDLSLFGLQFPSAQFTVQGRDDNQGTLLIGSRVAAGTQDRYVMFKDQPMVFAMKWEILSQLFPLSEILIDSTGSGISKFDIKRITIRTSQMSYRCERTLDRWQVMDGGPIVDSESIAAMLNWLLDAQALSVAISQYPTQSEVATVTFEGYDERPLDTVRIATNEEGNWILENGDNVLRIHAPESGKVLQVLIR